MLEERNNFTADSIIEILELHPKEMELLRKLRTKYRFGDVTIIVRDGLPVSLKRITEIELL